MLDGGQSEDIPPNIKSTERKYEPMGNVTMATVKARSLKMMFLWNGHWVSAIEFSCIKNSCLISAMGGFGGTNEGTAGEMFDFGSNLTSSWSRWVFSVVLILRWVAMFAK
jgi:hypothetical protein